jgi:hypothetical protein
MCCCSVDHKRSDVTRRSGSRRSDIRAARYCTAAKCFTYKLLIRASILMMAESLRLQNARDPAEYHCICSSYVLCPSICGNCWRKRGLDAKPRREAVQHVKKKRDVRAVQEEDVVAGHVICKPKGSVHGMKVDYKRAETTIRSS